MTYPLGFNRFAELSQTIPGFGFRPAVANGVVSPIGSPNPGALLFGQNPPQEPKPIVIA